MAYDLHFIEHALDRESRMERGVALFKRKQVDEALAYLEAALDLEAGTPGRTARLHYYIAECHFGKRDYELAMYHYNTSIEMNPNDFQVYFDRGYLHQKQNRTMASIDDFTACIALNGAFPSAYHNRGIAYKQVGNIDMAIEDLRKAVAMSSSHVRTKKSLLDLLLPQALRDLRLGRYQEALSRLDECARLDPVPAQVFSERAAVYSRLGRYRDAVDDYTLALDLRPRSTDLLKGRADAHQRLGNIRAAMRDYMAILDVRPASNTASRGLSTCLLQAEVGHPY
ncbi:hypothetical protein PBRA_002609 [Plasmodiophora brassicae]|nr:hypothetical protein PBRA_002609 [Plasmodiophora brassicae]